MPAFRCAYCGEEFQGKSTQVYCSRSCAGRGRRDGISARPVPVPPKYLFGCKFNPGVYCFPAGDCGKCGWNPAVAAVRSKRILAKLKRVEVLTYDS